MRVTGRTRIRAWATAADLHALYLQELHGGELVGVEAVLPDGTRIPHYFNHLEGQDVDLSRSQFPLGTTYRNRKNGLIGDDARWPGRELERYLLFRERTVARR